MHFGVFTVGAREGTVLTDTWKARRNHAFESVVVSTRDAGSTSKTRRIRTTNRIACGSESLKAIRTRIVKVIHSQDFDRRPIPSDTSASNLSMVPANVFK